MSRARLACVTLALIGAAALGGCRRTKAPAAAGPPPPPPDVPPHLGPVTVRDLTAPDTLPTPVPLDTRALSAQLRAQLSKGGIFAGDQPDGGAGDGPVARVRAELALEEAEAAGKGAARAAVRFRVEVRPEGGAPHWNEDVQAGAETTFTASPRPDLGVLFGKLASRTLNDLATGYLARQRLWRGSEKELSAALTPDAGDLRIEAIHAVGERHLTDQAPTLLRLLTDDDEAVRDAALGALVELHDRRAVTELAKQRSMRDRREMRKILDAIAALGGQEAMDYLSFVADAHEDEEIRQMAKQALERLKRHADAQ